MDNTKEAHKKELQKYFLIIMFILATLLRIAFISIEKIVDYQYDVGVVTISDDESYDKIYNQDRSYLKEARHLDYIMTIHNTGKLPETNKVQHYHPPLHHLISASFLKLLDNFNLSSKTKLESLQILTCIYSIIAMFLVLKICDELKINNFYKIIVLLFVGFNPLFVIMSGFISNDMLVSMFIILTMYLLIKWYKNPSYLNTVLIGLILGLGCATKTSIAVMGIVIAGVVCFKWLHSLLLAKKDDPAIDKTMLYKTKKFLIQTLIFLIIATPMSIAFPIRNYKKFNQPFVYVVPPKKDLLVKETNAFKRYGPFSRELFEDEIHEENHNIFSYVIKSDLVFSLRASIHFHLLLKFLIILLFGFSLFASILLLANNKNPLITILIITCGLWLISFISFNIDFPASCTMHAKYIYAPIAFLPILSAYYLQEKDKYVMSMTIYELSTMFAIFSTIGILMNII